MPVNLLDIVKANGADSVVGLIEEAVRVTPEIDVINARTIRGITFPTLVRTGLGRTTGSFRAANAGTAPIQGTYENRIVSTYMLEARWECDQLVADGYEDGAAAYIAMEAEGVMQGEMQGLAKQFYYGSGNSADGYPGLIQAHDATNMVIDAGGTSAGTGSSVWLVRSGVRDVTWVWGNNGSLVPSPVRTESKIDPADAAKKFDIYVQTLKGRPGLQVGSTRSICRIKKLTADSGKGLTDALISQALAKFPVGFGPTVCFMTQRSLAQLQSARTATSPTGAPAPFPTSITGVDGSLIPIRVTEAISNTESLSL